MNNINYEELSKKLFSILEYECGRPEDVCKELMYRYGRYYNGTVVYHGSFGNTKEDVLTSYNGLVSCTYDLDVAESFARSSFSDNEELCTVFKVKLNDVIALDVQKLIEDCYNNLPNDELCKYMFEGYNFENELLMYYEDIQDNIEFLEYKDE